MFPATIVDCGDVPHASGRRRGGGWQPAPAIQLRDLRSGREPGHRDLAGFSRALDIFRPPASKFDGLGAGTPDGHSAEEVRRDQRVRGGSGVPPDVSRATREISGQNSFVRRDGIIARSRFPHAGEEWLARIPISRFARAPVVRGDGRDDAQIVAQSSGFRVAHASAIRAQPSSIACSEVANDSRR